jgi:hypothetical protein
MIQIERPINWTQEKLLNLAKELKGIEIYNAKALNKLEVVTHKWRMI